MKLIFKFILFLKIFIVIKMWKYMFLLYKFKLFKVYLCYMIGIIVDYYMRGYFVLDCVMWYEK